MEQNKTYIIILIVTIVSAGLIAAGLFLFTPREDTLASRSDGRQVESFDFNAFTGHSPVETPDGNGDAGSPASDGNSTDGQTEGVTQNGMSYGLNSAQADSSTGSGETEEIKVSQSGAASGTSPAEPAEGNTPAGSASASSESAGGADTDRESVDKTAFENTSAVVPAVVSAKSSESRGADTAAAEARSASGSSVSTAGVSTAAASVPREVREYWIQVFASTSYEHVIDVRDDLSQYGISGRINTQEKDSVLYYRLRYGPFEVKAEAEKFVEWLRHLERYSGSYISLEFHRR